MNRIWTAIKAAWRGWKAPPSKQANLSNDLRKLQTKLRRRVEEWRRIHG